MSDNPSRHAAITSAGAADNLTNGAASEIPSTDNANTNNDDRT